MQNTANRIWELDCLRGVAIILMVIFHFFFDLNYFGILQNAMYSGYWLIFQRVTLSLFLITVGVSLHLQRVKNPRQIFSKRFIALLAAAVLITIATWLYSPSETIWFGVIHLIALSTLLAIPFLNRAKLCAAIGTVMLAGSLFFTLPQINSPLLLWLGVQFPGFSSFDYVPLIPWFGLILIGIYLGKKLYPLLASIVPKPQNAIINYKINALQFLGCNSLVIYLIHQPLLFAAIKLWQLVR
ncbi:MAG: heparan-alpha-glucosaminide N-acetyltransferase [Candidatus Micrarchaeota archaeon]